MTIRPFQPADEAAVRAVMTAALAVDAYPGITVWDLDSQARSMVGAPESVAVAEEDGTVVGYVCQSDDLTVHPDFRRRGHGRRLFAAGLELAAQAGWDEFTLYVPSSGPGRDFAQAMGMAYRSSLWRLELPLATDVPEPVWPADVVTSEFGDWLPLQRYVDMINLTFADHPTPLSWTLAQVQHAHAQPDFDASKILLVSPATRAANPIAFARIALEPQDDTGSAPTGEIRLVGVIPEWRGRGLGRELLRWGVAELRARGAGRVQLTVEAQNDLALGLYRRTGFEPAVEWPHWTAPSRRVSPRQEAGLPSDDDR
jgi:mycothiol synthase